MIAPGATLSSAGRLAATIGAGTTATSINQGVGFIGANVAMDTNAPSGGLFDAGIAQNTSGAFFVTTAQLGTDTYVDGLRVSALGQLCIESADAATFSNGNGITAAGNLSVN